MMEMDTDFTKPRLRSNIIIHKLPQTPASVMLEDPGSHRTFMLREHEQIVVEHFDGNLSLQQVSERVSKKLGKRLSVSSVAKFAERLEQLGLLETGPITREEAKHAIPSDIQSRSTDLRLGGWARLLQLVASLFFSLKFCWLIWVALAMVFSRVTTYRNIYIQDLKLFLDTPYVWWTIILIYLGIPIRVFLHELGHTMATVHFTGRFIPIRMSFLVLNASVTPPNSVIWSLKRWQRVEIAMAGLYFQIVFLAVILTIRPFVELSIFLRQVCTSLMIPLVWSFVTNILPSLPGLPKHKTDGYFALSYLFDIPNFAANSERYIASLLGRDSSHGTRTWLAELSLIQKMSLVFYAAIPWLGALILVAGLWGISRFLISQIPSTGYSLTLVAALWGLGPYLLFLGKKLPKFSKKGGMP